MVLLPLLLSLAPIPFQEQAPSLSPKGIVLHGDAANDSLQAWAQAVPSELSYPLAMRRPFDLAVTVYEDDDANTMQLSGAFDLHLFDVHRMRADLSLEVAILDSLNGHLDCWLLLDGERAHFGFLGRDEQVSLPGFDEDAEAEEAPVERFDGFLNQKPLEELAAWYLGEMARISRENPVEGISPWQALPADLGSFLHPASGLKDSVPMLYCDHLERKDGMLLADVHVDLRPGSEVATGLRLMEEDPSSLGVGESPWENLDFLRFLRRTLEESVLHLRWEESTGILLRLDWEYTLPDDRMPEQPPMVTMSLHLDGELQHPAIMDEALLKLPADTPEEEDLNFGLDLVRSYMQDILTQAEGEQDQEF